MRERKDAGFSIVEVVVAMTVFSIGILAVAKTMDTSFATADRTSHRLKATALATQKLEEIRATAWNAMDLAPDDDEVGSFNRSWAIEDVAGKGFRRAVVTVSWVDSAGGHDVSQTSYLYPTAAAAPPTTTPGALIGGVAPSLATLAGTTIQTSGAGTLSWSPPANVTGHQIAKYIIQKSLNNSFTGHVWELTDSEPPNSNSFKINGLAAGTQYFFRIGAVYLDGAVSQWSPVQSVTTNAYAGALEPCKVHRVSTSPSSVQRIAPYPSQLEAAPVVIAETNGKCTGLMVHYTGPNGSAATPIPLTGSGGLLTATISNSVASQWQLGQYSVDVKSATNENKGSSSFLVCEQGSQCG